MARIGFSRKALVGGLFSVLITGSAAAKELRWTHYGLRPLGMGNAFVAVADDHNSLFYNPAGLARLETWNLEVLNPRGAISGNTVTFLEDLNKLASGGAGDTDAVLDILEKNTGKTHHFSLGLTPHFVMPGFGMAAGVKLDTTLAVHREIATDIDFGPRMIAPIGFAMNFLDGKLSVGGAVKIVARGGVNREFSINDIQAFTENEDDEEGEGGDSSEEDKNETELGDYFDGGGGIGVDAGILFTPIEPMEPTLGISVADIGGTAYAKKLDIGGEALGTPQPRLPAVNTGLSLKPWSMGDMYLLTSVDAHAINQPEHYSKKFNLGVEWGYGEIIKLQSGLHQGELTGGFEFDVFLFNCRFVTYAEQLGTVAGQDDDLRDRRYALQLKLLI